MASNVETGVDSGPLKKKVKVAEISGNYTVNADIKDLSTFQLHKILSNNSSRKTVCLQGQFGASKDAGLVILEKTAFEDVNLKSGCGFFTNKSSLKQLFHNDIYGNYECYPTAELNSIKTTIIHPATEKHILKYSIQNLYIVDETAELYNTITLPHITKEQFDLEWVYNIINHKSEKERIVFEDSNPTNGFILLPDLKWNGTTLENLYLLAIVITKDIKSLRDLTSEHLPLLKNIYEKGTEAIRTKYKLDKSQLRIYLHYQPSFYHLHVHFTYLKYEAPGILAEKAHLLSNVISNIELLSDYYQKITLPFVVKETDNLFKKFEEAGVLKKAAVQKE